MKKQLLLLKLVLMLFVTSFYAQDIKYWDFGAKELGAGFENVMPLNYLNAFANYNRQIQYTDENGVEQFPMEGYENESGHSSESLLIATKNKKYAGSDARFQVTSKGSSPTPPGGTLLGGGSLYTKPTNLADLDGGADLVFQRDSNSDRILTVNKNVTRFDERTEMPDNVDPNLFPGCLQFTTPGEKRWNRSGGRGFLINLEAAQWVTVVGAGQYTDIEGNGTLGFSTGYIKFQNEGGTGVPVEYNDWGSGTGAFEGPIDGADTGDEAPRVMQFQATDAGTYKLANRGGTLRVYRIYLGKVDVSLGANVETKVYENGVYSKTLALSTYNNTKVTTDLKARGNRVYVSGVKSKSEVKIYSITGALVKSLTTSEDIDFEFKSGPWIATIKTAEGTKSVKLLVQ
ncbi:T9SS type A sorting domain-containing protein [Wenyingzhuangia sp. chi5]|uniref:T9SS type A sorting domain-containing protein n=1 Tax=Wenyingzhuangia gilva TaxID=3057677 RepID=A0ABT8VTJ2_9FLAO|nr:T9SS type A sorting domain-containing protein [Wenyingzhuangia sp. chi5]MDO3695291.1 T9SS type A sorting domain-containing protein [Wenyingzhuangia sp. chi5]